MLTGAQFGQVQHTAQASTNRAIEGAICLLPARAAIAVARRLVSRRPF